MREMVASKGGSFDRMEDADGFAMAESAAPKKERVRDVGGLFGQQLASGLWDDASLGKDGEARRLRATVAVLRAMLEAGVDTAHALYGAQVRKALEAVVTAVGALGAGEKELGERALGLAWLLATGARTRSAVEGAVAKAGYTDLAARTKEPAQLRAWVMSGA